MRAATLLCVLFAVAGCATGDVEDRVTPDAGTRDVATQHDTGVDVPVSTDDDAGTKTTDDDVQPVGDAGATCVANHDDTITRSELNFLVGAGVLYAVNNEGTNVTPVDLTGSNVDGVTRWDYSAARPEDQRVLDTVMSPQGQWWSSLYSDATYAALIDRTNNILGVYRATATALQLLGTVSVAASQTNLAMSPPVDVLRFPLRVGDAWTQSVTAAGYYNFTPLTNITSYSTHVVDSGNVWTPAGRYPVLRVRTDLDQTIPFTIIRRTQRTYTFLSECWGVVARVASVDNESAEVFTTASEYRRLSL